MTTMLKSNQQTNKKSELHTKRECFGCACRSNDFFCNLGGSELRLFESHKITKIYPKGTLLFIEGQSAAGVYILCKGRVKLSTCSPNGKIIILGIAEVGDVLGLSAVISGVEYEATAELLERCQVNFVPNSDFLKLLQENPKAGMNAARQLSRSYHAAHKMICSLGHSDSVIVKLSKLFLSWSANGTGNNGPLQLKNSFTHEEIGEMIGTTRETVTRALRNMRERGLVTLKGSDLIIHNQDRLRLATGLRFAMQGVGNGECDFAHRRIPF